MPTCSARLGSTGTGLASLCTACELVHYATRPQRLCCWSPSAPVNPDLLQWSRTMPAIAATWRLGRHAMRIGILTSIISLIMAVHSPCTAEETASASAPAVPATADFCKGPSSTNLLVSGFSLMCGKRIPTGAFLGAFMSPGPDALGDCVKRCSADIKCKAFSLDGRERAEGRVCTLLGSHEAFTDEPAWVSGVRVTTSITATSLAIDHSANVGATISLPPNLANA